MNKSFLGIGAGCVAAAIAGYLLAGRTGGSAASDVRTSSVRSHSDVGVLKTSDHREEVLSIVARTPNQLAIVKENLRERFANSPAAARDWALREEAGAILATMKTRELEEFAKQLIPPQDISTSDWKPALVREIFRQWSLKDPAGASLAMADYPLWQRTEAFDLWLRRDPDAAQAWVTAGNFPTGSETAGARLQQDFLNRQVITDFSSASASLAGFDLETQEKTLLDWSQRLAHDPAKRDALLALLASRGDAEFTLKCYRGLVREMAVKSPSDASAFVENSNLSEDHKHALSEQVLGEWAVKDPHQAFAAWAELKEDAAPAPLLRAMDSWSLNSPGAEQAIDWVNKLDPGPAREQFKTHLIERMSGGERYAQAATLSASLDDPVERIRQMKIVKRQWEEKFPKWADEWFGKLPPADREALGRKLE